MPCFRDHLLLVELFKDRLPKNGSERTILAKSLWDANTSASSANLGFMMPKDRDHVFAGLGHEETAMAEAKQLLRLHSLGGAGQEKTDHEIYTNIQNKTPVGKVFSDFADYEEAVFKARGASLNKRRQASIKSLRDDWEWMGNRWAYDSADEQWQAEYAREFPEVYDIKLYRGGSLDKPVQSWTTDPEGAWTGSGRIRVDHQSSINALKQKGFRPIAGISHMVGASGECEILMVQF